MNVDRRIPFDILLPHLQIMDFQPGEYLNVKVCGSLCVSYDFSDNSCHGATVIMFHFSI